MPQNLHFKIAKTRDGKMQKILMLAFVFAMLGGGAFGYENWGNKAANDWWGPGVVYLRGSAYLYHNYNTNFLSSDKIIKKSSGHSETVNLSFIARRLVPHGGHFCMTQMRATNSGTTPITWAGAHYQETSPASKCFWMCEPGYTGSNCAAATGNELCENTKPTRDFLMQYGVNDTESGSIHSVEKFVMANGIMDSGSDETLDPHPNAVDVIVVAEGFDQAGGRGIIASPHTYIAFLQGGEDDTRTNYHITKGVEDRGSGYKSDVLLCTQGYSGPNCAKKCNECPDGKEKYDEGQKKCVLKNSWTMGEMMSKTYKGSGDDIPCWHLSDIAQYEQCMKGNL
jgi:hypothetical protein